MFFYRSFAQRPVIATALFLALAGCATAPAPTQKDNNKINIVVKNGVPSHYQVQSGDTVVKIAKRYDLNWREISAINRLDNQHTIYIGQWLVLWQPAKTPAKPKTETPKAEPPVKAEPIPTTIPPQLANRAGQVHTERVHAPLPSPQKPARKDEPKPEPKPEIKSEPKPSPKKDENQTAQALPTTHNGVPLLMPIGNTTQPFGYPVKSDSKIVRQFGATVNGVKSEGLFFAGQDGDLVAASQAGTVLFVANSPQSPKAVTVEHKNGYVSSYIHLKDIAVTRGQVVNAGSPIGTMQAQTSKLALFEFRLAKDGQFIDPMTVLK